MRIPTSASPDVQQAFRDVIAAVAPLLQTTPYDWQDRRLIGLLDGTDDQDAVTVAQLTQLRDDLGVSSGPRPAGKLAALGSGKVRIGAYSTRGAAEPHAGEWFVATDRNDVAWLSDGASWLYMFGIHQDVIANKPTLVTGDAGYLFAATDYARVYRWSGSAWADAPGEPARDEVAFFAVAPGTGWRVCDGSSVSKSTSTAGTTSVTLPDYSTAAYVKAGTSATVGPTAASGTTASESSHTHSVDPPSTQSSTPSSTVSVQGGVTFQVGDDGHRHTTDIAAFTSAAGSAHSHGPGTLELRNTQLLAYYRL